jgi:hypothetical protein
MQEEKHKPQFNVQDLTPMTSDEMLARVMAKHNQKKQQRKVDQQVMIGKSDFRIPDIDGLRQIQKDQQKV